jgi:hypothetical protein
MGMSTTIPGFENEIERLVGEHIAATRLAISKAVERAFARVAVSAASTPTGRASGRAASKRVSGARRAADEIGALAERLYEAVVANPGASMSTLAPALGVSPRELNRPAAQLRKADRLRTVGQRQATRYFPMAGKASTKS